MSAGSVAICMPAPRTSCAVSSAQLEVSSVCTAEHTHSLSRKSCTGQIGSLKGLTLAPGPVKHLSPLQGQEVHQLPRPVPGVLPNDAKGRCSIPGLHGHASHHKAQVGCLHLQAPATMPSTSLDRDKCDCYCCCCILA